MTKNTETRTFHVLTSGLTVTLGEWRESNVLYRGQEFTVTPEQYEFTRDKNGASWLDLTPDEQEARWGEQRFAEGPAPERMEVGEDDIDGLMYRKWLTAVEQAGKISNPAERSAEFKRIRETFPRRYASTQRTLRTYGD